MIRHENLKEVSGKKRGRVKAQHCFIFIPRILVWEFFDCVLESLQQNGRMIGRENQHRPQSNRIRSAAGCLHSFITQNAQKFELFFSRSNIKCQKGSNTANI